MEGRSGRTRRNLYSVLGAFGCSAVLVLTGFLAGGCTSVETPPTPYGIEHVVEHSKGSKPSWVDNIDAYRKAHDGRVYFVGMAIRAQDMRGGRTDAAANAMSQIANSVEVTVHNLYVGARAADAGGNADAYTADMQRAIEAGTLQEAKGVITGAAPDLYWWEKYWVQTAPGEPVQYYFNIYALVSLSKPDYEKTVFQTLNGVQASVDVPRADAVIKTMKDLWLKKRGV